MKMISMAKIENRPKYKLNIGIEIGNKIISINNRKSKLLQCIDKYESILKASKETGISYRTALKDIEIMEKELGAPIVHTKRGGKGGGGSSELTENGKQILFKFIKINRILKERTDLNEVEGTVSAVDEENKVMKINLHEKELLFPAAPNLSVGDEVFILIKPSDIILMPETHESKVMNIFEATINEMQLKNDLIHLNMDVNGNEISADIPELPDDLDLNPGKKISIGFNADSADIIKKEI